MIDESYILDPEISVQYTDYQNFKNSFMNFEAVSKPYKVMGRKINSEALLTNNPENPCRYPLPVQIPSGKPKRIPKRHLQDISNRPRSQNSKPRYKSKTPDPIREPLPKPSSDLKKIYYQKATVKNNPSIKQVQNKSKISIEIPFSIKENSVAKKNIDSIVSQTLKKQQKQKKQAEKSKIEEKDRQILIKKQLAELNKNTRMENYNRFKKNKFYPKYPWGIDERRVTRVNDSKILKEAEELRKKKREERERSKSAGRSRIGLDVLKLKKDHTKIQDEEIPPKKQTKERDKSIIVFMKKQRKQRQRSKELLQEKVREDENKRLMQLLELEKMTRKQPKRHRSSKLSHKKTHKKNEISLEESCMNFSEDEEVMGILNGARSLTPDSYEIRPQITSFDYRQNGRECAVFGVFPETSLLENQGNGTQIVNEIVEQRHKTQKVTTIASATAPLADVKASYSVVNTEEEYKESSSSDISKRKEQIRKKLAELRNRVDKAKENKSEDYDENRNQAATKIQAFVRGFLTRQALRRYFAEVDEQTPNESDYDWMFEKKSIPSSQISYEEDYEVENIMNKSYSRSYLSKDKRDLGKSFRKDQEIERILKSQAEWREIQKKKLVMLKNKDLEEMRAIAKKVGSEDLLMIHFEEIIERRYEHIDQLFDENIEAVKFAVQNAIEQENPESLLQTLEKQENFASALFENLGKNPELDDLMKLKQQFDFKSIWNYSESAEQSVRISELDPESNTQRSIINSTRMSPEFLLTPFKIIFTPSISPSPLAAFEPCQALFHSDIADSLSAFIEQECYKEALEEVWDIVLTSSSFINDIAERLLMKIVQEESYDLSEPDMFALISISQEFSKSKKEIPALALKQLEYKGISMDEKYILQYIYKLFEYLKQIDFDIETVLNYTNVLDPLEMLSKMQEAEIGVIIEKFPNIRILPLHLYLDLEKESNINNQIQEAQHIHNKMIFDVVNESLFKKGKKPQPMPWSFDLRTLKGFSVDIEKIIDKVVEEIKELSRVRAGKVPKIEFFSNSDEAEEDIIQQLREEQLSSILAVEIVDQEPDWINYEFEETQVKLDLADMTLEYLVEELISILNAYEKL
jgi:Domain of unknown function (DUF4378)/IQ calmodulin-binding motif